MVYDVVLVLLYQNGKDLTETEEIKKRWQEYTENYIKKVLMAQISMMGSHSLRSRYPGV